MVDPFCGGEIPTLPCKFPLNILLKDESLMILWCFFSPLIRLAPPLWTKRAKVAKN